MTTKDIALFTKKLVNHVPLITIKFHKTAYDCFNFFSCYTAELKNDNLLCRTNLVQSYVALVLNAFIDADLLEVCPTCQEIHSLYKIELTHRQKINTS